MQGECTINQPSAAGKPVTTLPDINRMIDNHMHQTENLLPCGLMRRLAAMIYDTLLVIALLMIAAAVIVIPVGSELVDGHPAFQAWLLMIWFLYFAVCWRHGQTVGMKAWRIHLLSHSAPAGWGQLAIRFLVAGLSIAAFGLGLIWSLLDRQHRSWHDLASRTDLVYLPRADRNTGKRSAG